MVKIRLRRIGAKGRPFYRVVVSKSESGRNGAFVETLGTYDPIANPSVININEERALHWLLEGAQPTETTAYVLKRAQVLEKFFEQRPAAKKNYRFLDKAIPVQMGAPEVKATEAKAAKAAPEAPATEATAEAPATEAPAAEGGE